MLGLPMVLMCLLKYLQHFTSIWLGGQRDDAEGFRAGLQRRA